MTMRAALIAFYCTLAMIGMAHAKDRDGSFAVKGVGVLQCQSFVAAASANTPDMVQYAGYVTGYISAFNELSPETFDALPWQQVDTVVLLILQRCGQTPEKNFAAVVSEVTRYFARNKISQSSAKVRFTAGGRTLELYQPVVDQIKQALAEWGYPNDDLPSSLKAFQRDNNLAGKHPFDQLILLKLLYSRQTSSPGN